MESGLPHGVAIVVLGPGAAALARRAQAVLPGARVHGPRAAAGAWDESYDRAVPHIAALFAAGRPVLGICAAGILIRAAAPLLADKTAEPPLVALAADGSVAVPLLGGHRGGNALSRHLARHLGAAAAITTAEDLRFGLALDEPPPGWRVADPAAAKRLAARLLAGHRVALADETGCADWLRAAAIDWADDAEDRVLVTDRAVAAGEGTLVFHPPILALGIGCERNCPAEEIAALAGASLAAAGLAAGAVAAIVSVEAKLAESGIDTLARALGVPARFFSAERLLEETPRLSERSAAAFRATGCWGVAEGAALAAAGKEGVLVAAKRKSRGATCAIARAPRPIDARGLGRARGTLAVVGIGPGGPEWRTREAEAALAAASDIVGYRLYLDLLGPAAAGKRLYGSAIGEEEKRVRLALDLAAEGGAVALVSSGDAGIYGLASLVFELLDREARPDWSAVAVSVSPGVSAMQAAAARIGAPLGHDFCAISLSDLLTPWTAIERRLEAAAAADFVVALYNPRSSRRPARLGEAAAILLRHRAPETPVFIARNLARRDEAQQLLALSRLAAAELDMLSLAIVGSSRTRRLAGDPPRLYTPRGYFERPPG